MIERVEGVLLSAEDVKYALAAFDVLLTDRRPSARLDQFIGQLRKTVARVSDTGALSDVDARKIGAHHVSADTARYDLVDTAEAASILGCTASNVRDLVRRKVLPAYSAGGRRLIPAAAVVSRAERRTARKAR